MKAERLIQGAIIDKDREEGEDIEHVELRTLVEIIGAGREFDTNLSNSKELGCVA